MTPAEKRIYVIGAGGHAKAIIGAAQMAGFDVLAAFDDNAEKWGSTILGVPVIGPVERLVEQPRAPTIVGVGDPVCREAIVERLSLDWATVVHPNAFFHPSVKIGPGTILFAGSIVQPDSTIGAHAILNANCTVAHDGVVEDYAHLAPGVDLAGTVHVERGAFLGIGAVVINNVRIGARTIVGAAAAVTHNLPPDVVAVGVPARPIKYRDGRPYDRPYAVRPLPDPAHH